MSLLYPLTVINGIYVGVDGFYGFDAGLDGFDAGVDGFVDGFEAEVDGVNVIIYGDVEFSGFVRFKGLIWMFVLGKGVGSIEIMDKFVGLTAEEVSTEIGGTGI